MLLILNKKINLYDRHNLIFFQFFDSSFLSIFFQTCCFTFLPLIPFFSAHPPAACPSSPLHVSLTFIYLLPAGWLFSTTPPAHPHLIYQPSLRPDYPQLFFRSLLSCWISSSNFSPSPSDLGLQLNFCRFQNPFIFLQLLLKFLQLLLKFTSFLT